MENPTCIKCICNRLKRRWRLFCAGAPYVSLDLSLCLWMINFKIIQSLGKCIKRFKWKIQRI